MRILLIGNTGQLGWELEKNLAPLGEVTAVDYPELDIGEEEGIRRFLRQKGRFQVIVNAAAYTNVDRAESEIGRATAVNAAAPGILAKEARDLGAALIHYSTDYVFDGAKGTPYAETDGPAPVNVYGKTKLAGEQAVISLGGAYLIFRTAWVYSLRRDSFVTKVLEWSRRQRTLKVVDDQVSNPTWAGSLAEATRRILEMAVDGSAADAGKVNQERFLERISARAELYHLAGDGFASRFEWAKEILALDPKSNEQIARELLPAKTADFPTAAMRPLFSALDCGKFERTFGFRLMPWKDALRRALDAGEGETCSGE